MDNFNYIGNLQLLEGLDNISKNNKDLKSDWERICRLLKRGKQIA